MDDKIISAIASIVQYNGLDDNLKSIKNTLLNTSKEDYITLKDIDFEDKILILPGNRTEIYLASQVHFIYMLLVMLYGNYGTSPRFGWIEDNEGAAAFIDKLLND